MAMQVPGGDGQKAEINVTPMIDVLLVLLIIFMVIVPLSPVGLDTQVSREPRPGAPMGPDPTQLVITIHPDGSAEFNQELVAKADLTQRFREIYRIRGDRPMFLKAEPEIPFGLIANVIDAARGAELTQVAFLPRP